MGVGAVVGAGAASSGVPEGVRQTFLAMQNGDQIHNAADFMHAVGVASIATVRAAATGAVMNVVAGPARGLATKAVGNKILGAVIGDSAAAAAGVGTGVAMSGQMPSANDWFSAGAMVLVQHGSAHLIGQVKAGVFRPSEQTTRVASNMQDIYRRTGVTPWQQQELARRDPNFAHELLGQDVNGDPSTPNFNKVAPKEPPPYQAKGQPAPGEDETAAFVKGRENEVTGGTLPPPAKDRVTPAVGSENARITEPLTRSTVQQLEGSTTYAVSNKGAIGRNQITLGAARQFGYGTGLSDEQLTAWLKNDTNNDAVADKYVAWANEHYRGDTNAALVSYNAGPKWASEYLVAGPGTALEAVKDPSTRSGWAYHPIAAERDESFLPPETQRYLAHARFLHGVTADPDTLRPEREIDPKDFPNARIVTNHRGEQVPLVTLHTRSGASYQVNARFAKNFQGFVDDLEAAGYHIRTIDGYQDRDVPGRAGRPSFHDQGAAIDVNGHDNPFLRKNHGLVNGRVVTDLPANVQQIAEKHGLGWGGAWATEKDAMHFSIASEEGGSVAMSRTGGRGGPPAPPEQPEQPAEGGPLAKAGGGQPPAPPGGPPKLPGPPAEPPEENPWEKAPVGDLYAKVDENIGEPDKAPSMWSKERLLTQYYSELTPAYNVDRALAKGGVIDTEKDLGIEDMARQTYASDQRTAFFVNEGPMEIGPKDEIRLVKDGHSVKDAMAEAMKKGTFDRWVKWMVNERANKMHKDGFDTGFDEQATAALAANEGERAKYAKATAMLNDTLNYGLRYARDSGVLSTAQMEAIIKANPIYMSFRRIMGDDGVPGGASQATKFAARNPLYKFEGSDRQISDPFGATIDNLRVLISMADRNRLAGSVVGLAESGKYPGEIEKVKSADTDLKALPDNSSQALALYGQGG
ncbi:MAG TPA: M15 family metallopeptidase, partial [Caulobacteraceae bacterium]|nr:M15 family metallopeptidase [Caulobacteraceae bacterium]